MSALSDNVGTATSDVLHRMYSDVHALEIIAYPLDNIGKRSFPTFSEKGREPHGDAAQGTKSNVMSLPSVRMAAKFCKSTSYSRETRQ